MTKLSPLTLKNYKLIETVLRDKLGLGDNYPVKLNNPKLVISRLKKYYDTANTRKSYLSRIKTLIKDPKNKKRKISVEALQEYDNAFKIETKTINDQLNKSEIAGKFEKNWIEWSEIVKMRNQMAVTVDSSNWIDYQNFVIMALYTYLPPTRAENFANVKIVFSKSHIIDDKNNYLVLRGTKGYFVFNKYKTVKIYGPQEVNLPMNLINITTKWLHIRPPPNDKTKNWMLVKDEDGISPLNADNISKRVFKIFRVQTGNNNLKFGIDMLRHSFLSYFANLIKNLEQRKEIARIMGHSVETQLQYVKNKQGTEDPLKEYIG